jgi:transcriptional regulator with XRE-family HTH domain
VEIIAGGGIVKPKIRELREEKHWSQKYLAEVLGVGQNTLSRWERGAYYPSLAYLSNITENTPPSSRWR